MTGRGQPGADGPIRLSGRVYGVDLRGDLPAAFAPYLRPPGGRVAGGGRPLAVSYRVIRRLPAVAEIWASEAGPRAGERFALFRHPTGVGLTVTGDGGGLFRIASGAIAIEWQRGDTGAAHHFFSHALPLWLELAGVPVLHASAVAFGERAVAFVGPTGSGKSTLCAGLVGCGCAFVADDGLPLREGEDGEWRCAPGPPGLRLWPSALERGLGIPPGELTRMRESVEKRMLACDAEALAADTGAGLELAAVYVLDGRGRHGGEVATAARTARQALVRLIEHSLAGGPVAALGLSAARLETLSRVAIRIPVRTLRYPPGADHWELVRRAIAGELAGGAVASAPRR